MRILLTVKNFDFGGAENHVCELANALDQLGHQVFVLGRKGRQVQRLNPGVTFVPSSLSSGLIVPNLIHLCRTVRRHRIQLIHAHQRYAIHLTSLASLCTHTPFVLTVHGRSQYDLRSWTARRYAKKVLFVSDFVMKMAERFPGIPPKSILIQNGIPISKTDSPRTDNQLCYVSRIDQRHSDVLSLMIREVLPKLLAIRSDLEFHIVGEGKVLSQVRAEAEKLDAASARKICHFHGYCPEVCTILQESALVMGVGRVALEALSCGTPVLSINKKRMGELLSTTNYPLYRSTNFVAVGQPAPTADSLFLHLNDFFLRPAYWMGESKALQKQVREDFDSRKTAGCVVDVYLQALQST
jgi:glycosyltransferase involved in cell wall biosynthesis